MCGGRNGPALVNAAMARMASASEPPSSTTSPSGIYAGIVLATSYTPGKLLSIAAPGSRVKARLRENYARVSRNDTGKSQKRVSANIHAGSKGSDIQFVAGCRRAAFYMGRLVRAQSMPDQPVEDMKCRATWSFHPAYIYIKWGIP